MRRKEFICKNCGCHFVVEIFEEGEAKEKGLRGSPVRCKKCGSGNIEEQ